MLGRRADVTTIGSLLHDRHKAHLGETLRPALFLRPAGRPGG
ncbi:hypothetical protein I546_5554 [Mycobacterium kansasii 732]|nr:hypothetical protein I546_5554 [Mycobacterium kansasii 732]